MNLRERLEADIRMQEGLKRCFQCGTCTAICPAAGFYEYDPRIIVETVQRGNEEEIEQLLSSDTIWYCGECLSCKTRCPRGNTPGYIVQSLRNLSQELGYFRRSAKGRQQLEVKRTIGQNILNYGYCVYIDEMDLEGHPEQGPVWEWYRRHAASILNRLGAAYKKEGPGTLRTISKEDLDELQTIFAETGALKRFEMLEHYLQEEISDAS
ncbi:MAG: 4Fe-4S dicluster domain-containing protein [Bacteroidetes bacterium]|nr:MAG: 4Fe-4S dicluster domain-containing protein [Bacteroidota bacterium]